MEENITLTLADFWVTETKFYQKGYYTDYITNQDKRITTDLTHLLERTGGNIMLKFTSFLWIQGTLIFRAKAVTDDDVIV